MKFFVFVQSFPFADAPGMLFTVTSFCVQNLATILESTFSILVFLETAPRRGSVGRNFSLPQGNETCPYSIWLAHVRHTDRQEWRWNHKVSKESGDRTFSLFTEGYISVFVVVVGDFGVILIDWIECHTYCWLGSVEPSYLSLVIIKHRRFGGIWLGSDSSRLKRCQGWRRYNLICISPNSCVKNKSSWVFGLIGLCFSDGCLS